MQKIKIGLIRTLSVKDKRVADIHGRLIEEHFPSLQIISKCVKNQPKGINDDKSEEIAIPKIVKLGVKIEEEEKVKAIIVSCAADPGVEELRKLLKIPVIGAGSAVAALALSYSNKVGVLGITEQTPQIMKKIIGPNLLAEERPVGVKTTFDLQTEEGKKNIFNSVNYLKAQGVEIIALACTGYSTIGIANDLEKEINVPVLDAVIAAGLFAWHFTRVNMIKNR